MKARAVLTLLISLGVAGLAAFVANAWIEKRLGSSQAVAATENMGQVVSAAMDIPIGTQIDATHVKVIPIPKESLSVGSITKLDDAVGLVASQSLYAGEILTEKRLKTHEGGSPLAAVIETGKRALTVRVDDVIGVAGFLLPGNRVDIVSTKRGGPDDTTSETIVQNLKVLAVDQTASSNKNEPVIVRAVTLEVSPKQAELIVKATQIGKVQLTLRNPLDMDVSKPAPAPVATAEVKPKQQWSGYRVDVIRGTQVSRTSVTN